MKTKSDADQIIRIASNRNGIIYFTRSYWENFMHERKESLKVLSGNCLVLVVEEPSDNGNNAPILEKKEQNVWVFKPGSCTMPEAISHVKSLLRAFPFFTAWFSSFQYAPLLGQAFFTKVAYEEPEEINISGISQSYSQIIRSQADFILKEAEDILSVTSKRTGEKVTFRNSRKHMLEFYNFLTMEKLE